MKIATILDHIDSGYMALPEFQRGYVWNRDQVRGLIWSLYKRYPVGSLLTWVTRSGLSAHRGDQVLTDGVVKLLLDGQQRITSLYGVIRGKAPAFFDGDANAFTGLFFNLESEEFSFYMQTKMQGNPLWVDVSRLLQENITPFVPQISNDPELVLKLPEYIQRMTQLYSIRDIDVYVDEVTGEDKTIDVVVDIFNRVNSGGTKLSKGDLALARICSEEPEARQLMRRALDDWKDEGFDHFKLDWLLRNVTALIRGEARFNSIHTVEPQEFRQGLQNSIDHVNKLLDIIAGRLGLDHMRVLFGYYSFPVLVRFLAGSSAGFDDKTINAVLFWYAHAAMWGRYSGSTESVMTRDLSILEESGNDIEALIQELNFWRGSLDVKAEHFNAWSRGARFYPVLYMLTRVTEARDWGLGIPLKKGMLGKNTSLEVHHIFPRNLLRKHGYQKSEINAVANYCFLTKGTNLKISDRTPEAYFREIESNHPGALASQWIPMDPELWKVENYPEFLAERRKLLARAANDFLQSLYQISSSAPVVTAGGLAAAVPGSIDTPDEERLLREVQEWLQAHALHSGELEYELEDRESGELVANIDLAWPDGIQQGLSEPVALLIDEASDTVKTVADAGFKCFESVAQLKEYVATHILGDTFYGLPDWAQDVTEMAVPVVRHLVKSNLPNPQVGFEIQTAESEVLGELELAWPDVKVGIYLDQFKPVKTPDHWYLLPVDLVRENPKLLDVALRRQI